MNLMTSLTGWFESLDKILFFSILGILHDDEATESGPLPDATVPAVSGDIHHVTLFCSNARKCFRWGFKMKEGCFQGCECKTEELCVFFRRTDDNPGRVGEELELCLVFLLLDFLLLFFFFLLFLLLLLLFFLRF